ncbi:helix-turn-helix domain-containing protein [Halocynthiibacter namhaensis]|uniref:helix-turn-helix domain-containing protein n=1 Tax=Halocynthiibacter namhaensis TaxID=1290553 RepID=UPI00057925C9|nr:helix-turn-helix domain-containing protein [Halocynthiibacter namhaensis]
MGRALQNMKTQTSTSSQERVLAVLQVIILRKSADLNEITNELQISRSSSYRAIQVLVNYGWVRPRSGDCAYVLSAHFVEKFGGRTLDAYTAECCLELVTDLLRKENLHSELALQDASGRLRVIESTSKESYIRGGACDVAQAIARIIHMVFEPREVANDSALLSASSRGKSLFLSGVHIHNSIACIAFKTEWSEVGIWSIWPVQKFSNSASHLVRTIGHLRRHEIFTLPDEIDFFYSGHEV